jgi:hypothetical protein
MNRAAKCLCVVAASLLAAAHPTGQQADDAAARWRNQFLQGGELTLTQDYGRAMYARCVLTAVYFQPPLPGTDRLELRCTPNVRPLIDDVFATRMLSADEVSAIAKVAGASDLYSGGHAGNFGAAPGSEGPFERLEVGHCCGNGDRVVLIVTGNPTFAKGNRRALLDLLAKWREPLMTQLRNQSR